MSWFKNLFSTPPKTSVEMKMSPEQKKKTLQEEISNLEFNSIERLKKEIEYTELSHMLNPEDVPQVVYEKVLADLKSSLRRKMLEQEEKDWQSRPGDQLFSKFGGGKRGQKSKKRGQKSKKRGQKSKKRGQNSKKRGQNSKKK